MTDNATWAGADERGRGAKVWDLGIRLFHWSLVLLVSVAVVSGLLGWPSLFDVHLIVGTAIAVLVVYRLVWGFTGSTYARFASFISSPLATLRHLREVVSGTAPTHTGHNPAGAAMIVGLLLALVVLVVSGAVVLGGIFKEGPLASFAGYATGRAAKEMHELVSYAVIGLVALHVLGTLFESRRTGVDLVRSMIHGRKSSHKAGQNASQHDDTSSVERGARPLLATGLIAVILVSLGALVVHASRLPVPGVRNAPLPDLYVSECKACHAVHSPSIAPAATWHAIIAGLDDHFGENASLDPAVAAELARYLRQNSAEHWDTKAANRFTAASEIAPLRITATEGWRRLHRTVSDSDFTRRSVGGRLNCTACHSDAEQGRFAPRNINIPEETTP
ncbi:MAG: cytochrome b/b6 domain-containing protein [Hyphomicrobiaceae bacterium]|nr:cytochrome b/b6 domain-containing protein [Hyphomicrobiaceae bacterium]